jgi:pimeloyl-ACP methyl ester carboxylesterase
VPVSIRTTRTTQRWPPVGSPRSRPDGYLSDAALVFGHWPFRLEDVRCHVALWYGERDAQAPPRNGEWLAERLTDATLQVKPGLGHLESLVRSWDAVLGSAAGGA